MKTPNAIAALTLIGASMLPLGAQADTYAIDGQHGWVTFTIKHGNGCRNQICVDLDHLFITFIDRLGFYGGRLGVTGVNIIPERWRGRCRTWPTSVLS